MDESINIMPSSDSYWIIYELYPQKRNLFVLNFKSTFKILMGGTSAMVLEFRNFSLSNISNPILLNVTGNVEVKGTELRLSSVSAEMGSTPQILVVLPQNITITNTSINNVSAKFQKVVHPLLGNAIFFDGLVFAGQYFPRNAEIPMVQKGDLFTGEFNIPGEVFKQLQQRKLDYPINWKIQDYDATWLIPHRLLLFINIEAPDDSSPPTVLIDDMKVPLQKSYNTRSRIDSEKFLGYFVDISRMPANVTHEILVIMDTEVVGDFVGVFFENVETMYTGTWQQQ